MGEDKAARLVPGQLDGRSRGRLHGQPVSDEQIQAWADEAEAGYDVAALEVLQARSEDRSQDRSEDRSGAGRGRGRPPVGAGPGAVVAVRLDAASVQALTARARAEGITTRSEAIRAAVAAWAPVSAGEAG